MRAAALVVLVLFLAAPSQVAAQMKGRVGIGVSVTEFIPPDRDMHKSTGVGLTLQRIPKKGWGPSGGFNWFEAAVDGDAAGIPGRIGTLRVRPLMAGVSRTWTRDRLSASASIVGGPSFNRLRLDESVRSRVGVVDNAVQTRVGRTSVAIRPGLSVLYALKPRLALSGFGGYLVNRPAFTLRTAAGDIHKRWKADALSISGGLVVAVF